MKLTEAQRNVLRRLEKGYMITLRDDYYTVINKGGAPIDRIWPTTFYGLFDHGLVERRDDGAYTISTAGRDKLK